MDGREVKRSKLDQIGRSNNPDFLTAYLFAFNSEQSFNDFEKTYFFVGKITLRVCLVDDFCRQNGFAVFSSHEVRVYKISTGSTSHSWTFLSSHKKFLLLPLISSRSTSDRVWWIVLSLL